MDDTWFGVDLPVLEAAVQYLDEDPTTRPNGADLARMTGLDLVDVGKAMRRLDGEYVRLSRGMGGPETTNVVEVNGDARREVGQWPTAQRLAERIVAGLAEAIEREPDEERRGRLRRGLETVSGMGKGVVTEVVASVITKSAGLQ